MVNKLHKIAEMSENHLIFAHYFALDQETNERQDMLTSRRDYNQYYYAAVRTASDWSVSDVVLQRLGINGGGAISANTYDRSYDHTGISTHIHQQSHLPHNAQSALLPSKSLRGIVHHPSGDERCGNVPSGAWRTGRSQGAC